MKIIRRSIASILSVVAIILVVWASAPYLMDARTVRAQLFAELSRWALGDLKVDGPVSLTNPFELTVQASDVEIREPTRFSNVALLSADRIEARLSLWAILNGRIEFQKVWVDGIRITLKKPLKPFSLGTIWRAALINEPAYFNDAIEIGAQAPFSEIELNEVTLAWPKSDATPIPALKDMTIRLQKTDDGTGARIEARVRWHRHPVTFTFSRGPFKTVGPTQEAQLKILARTPEYGRLTASGKLVRANGTRFLGTVNISQGHLAAFARLLNLHPGQGLRDTSLSGSAHLEASRDQLSLQRLQAEAGDTRITGLLRLDLADAKPTLSGTLGLSDVDLRGVKLQGEPDGLFAASDPLQARLGGASARGQKLGAWLQRANADLRLSAESLTLNGLPIGQSAAFLSLRDGVATLDVAETLMFDGTLNGHFTLRWRDGQFHLNGKGRATGIEISQFLAMTNAGPLASGRSELSFIAAGSGATIAALMRAGKLKGRLMAVQGGDLIIDVAALAAEGLRRRRISNTRTLPTHIASVRARYERLAAVFRLSASQLHLDQIKIAQSGWIIRGKGRTDLANDNLNLHFRAGRMTDAQETVTPSSRETSIGLPAERTIQLHLTGPLHHPRVIYQGPAPKLSGARG